MDEQFLKTPHVLSPENNTVVIRKAKSTRQKLYVKKRDNSIVPVSYDEITRRLEDLCDMEPELDHKVNAFEIAQAVIKRITNDISTSEIDTLTAENCALNLDHPDYGKLASRLVVSSHHKNVTCFIGSSPGLIPFSTICDKLYNNEECPLISDILYEISKTKKLDNIIDLNRDFLFDFFGYKTLLNSYLLKVGKNDIVIETPQHMYLRVAIGIHATSIPQTDEEFDKLLYYIKDTYDLLSLKYMTHATPTLFNAGTQKPQLFSCFLMSMEDSINGIYKCVSDTAKISKWAGGIGMSISDIRANNARIKGTNGHASGVVPMLKVFNATARYVNQGGKRNGSFAVYMEPWHADIFEFLECKLPHGSEEERARDLFYALWIPNLFMERVREKGMWSLMCPYECPGLTECHGTAFNKLYLEYEKAGRYRKQIEALELWDRIIKTQIETSIPYMLYKDHVNEKSNHKHLGTIKSSNLCVSYSTRILTDEGYKEIGPLKDRGVNVWNGKQWAPTIVRQTGTAQKLLKITFSNGSVLNCTPYHKFYIETQTTPARPLGPTQTITKMVEAQMLKVGTKLIKFSLPLKKDGEAFPHSYTSGQHLLSNTYYKLKEQRNNTNITVKSVEDGGIGDTYCFDEPLEHKGIFEGILTGQCVEICEYNDTSKYACCVLASIILPTYVAEGVFDYQKLYEVVRSVTRNLDNIIDINYYPVPETYTSNMSERPLGIGVQGLADVFFKLKLPFDSPGAASINKKIFETIYFAAMSESCELATKKGPHPSYPGSPVSQGILQFDMWGVKEEDLSRLWNWAELREKIAKHGVRNSLVTAQMPTASTAQIAGSVEAIEPVTSNLYTRNVLAGVYVRSNKYLMDELVKRELWNEEMKNSIMKDRGSVQNIKEIPQDLKDIFKTAWEIKQSVLIDMSADRGPFVDQSQSLNLFFSKPDYKTLTKAHHYSYSKGLKTASYYIHGRPASEAESFTVKQKQTQPTQSVTHSTPKIENKEQQETEGCDSCGA